MKGCRKLTEEEIELIKANLSVRDRAIFVIGYRTGFRIQEIFSLLWKDIGEEISLKRKNAKGKIEGRIVPKHYEVEECLKEYIDSLREYTRIRVLNSAEPIFSINKSTYWRALKRACKKAGISGERVSSHATRKTFAAMVYEITDGNIWLMKKALGHKNINSTASYVDIDDTYMWKSIKERK